MELSHNDAVTHRDHQRLPEWLKYIGLRDEIEPGEWDSIIRPLGQLTSKERINLIWRTEGAGSLLWALDLCEPLPYDDYMRLDSFASDYVFNDNAERILHHPQLRSREELEHFTDLYLMLHWRLREYSLRPRTMDFVAFAQSCQWAIMPIGDVEIIDNDLALRGQPISHASEVVFRDCWSCALERHQAANWLMGDDPIYSEVATDT